MRVPVVDVGGSHVKALLSGQTEPRREFLHRRLPPVGSTCPDGAPGRPTQDTGARAPACPRRAPHSLGCAVRPTFHRSTEQP
jgi:hypothetical protein